MTRISVCVVAALLTAAAVTSARKQPRDGATTTQAATATIRSRVTAALDELLRCSLRRRDAGRR